MISRAEVLAKAAEWVGMLERTGRNDIWFADDWGITGQAWCFAFVQSCFWYAGPGNGAGALPLLSFYCPTGVQYARDNGQSIEVEQAHLVLPGDIVFFSWDMSEWPRWRSGTGDHIGIVESYGGGDTVYTIEGNIGNPQGVHRVARSIGGTVINFWRPPVFSDGGAVSPAAPVQQEEEDLTPQEHEWLEHIARGLGFPNTTANPWGILTQIDNYIDTGTNDLANMIRDQVRDNINAIIRDEVVAKVVELLAKAERSDHYTTRLYQALGGDAQLYEASSGQVHGAKPNALLQLMHLALEEIQNGRPTTPQLPPVTPEPPTDPRPAPDPPAEPEPPEVPTEAFLSPPQIREAQSFLVALGYPLLLSGMLDEDTVAGVRWFQQGAGLPVTGQLDDTTSDRLRQLVIQMASDSDAPQFEGANP